MNRVVVVEDETMARKGIILTIDWSALGCLVVGEAANGEEGAALIERLSPDIVVTDAPHGWRGDDREAAGEWMPG